jgi:hypothetical protein
LRILLLLFAAGSIISCHSDALLEPEMQETRIQRDTLVPHSGIYNAPNGKNFFIVGDTTHFYKEWNIKREALDTKTIEILKGGIDDPDLKGKPFRMIVTGGGISAGVRNGGYNNENMMTSFPNLIANQMGIEFNQPYFDKDSYNGYGTLLSSTFNPTGGLLPKFKYVTNNLGLITSKEGNSYELMPLKRGDRVDNFSMRVFKGFRFTPSNLNERELTYERLIKNAEKVAGSYTERILQEKFDFIIEASNLSIDNYTGFNWGMEQSFPNGFEGYVDERKNCMGPCHPKFSDKINFLLELKKRTGVKGVLFTSMPTYELPFLNVFKPAEVRSILEIYQRSYLLDPLSTRLLPSTTLDSLIGNKVNIILKPYVSLNREAKIPGIKYTEGDYPSKNHISEVYSLGKQLNWAVVDLAEIFSRVIKGSYISPDGFKVDTSIFFSEDGIYLSSLGQAVIANETIKSINAHYKTRIPLINTRDFLK